MIYKTLHRKLKIEQHEPHSSSTIDNSLYATKHINHKFMSFLIKFGTTIHPFWSHTALSQIRNTHLQIRPVFLHITLRKNVLIKDCISNSVSDVFHILMLIAHDICTCMLIWSLVLMKDYRTTHHICTCLLIWCLVLIKE